MIEFGSKVRDTVTGLTGTATGRAEYMHRPPCILVEPPINEQNGRLADSVWVNEKRIEVVDEDAEAPTE